MIDPAAVAVNLSRLRARIAGACTRAGRDPGEVTLVAVSKRQPVEAIDAAAEAGQVDVGENYAAEMTAKMKATSATGLRWHFIGQLQRNKVKLVVGHVARIHAVDSERLLRAINARAQAIETVQPVLVAVNIAGEATKSGVAPEDLAHLIGLASALGSVRCTGLMTMPPLPRAPEDSRPFFRELRRLRDALATADQPLPELSMGTTGDLEIAVEEAATWLRVGTAIFGERE